MNLVDKTIELFKTDVQYAQKAGELLRILLGKYPAYKMNFDLNDRDNLLRVESRTGGIDIAGIIELMRASGHFAELLED